MTREEIKSHGVEDAKAGRSIDAYYALPLPRFTEANRAIYEIGWRSVKKEDKVIRESTQWTAQDSNDSVQAAMLLHSFRLGGWRVAVHNDYSLRGILYTFWLLTNGIYCAKGDGTTDFEAILEVKKAIDQIEKDM
jgi:hypothetical protein